MSNSKGKKASSQAAWALITHGVTSAALEVHRLRQQVDRALTLVNRSKHREHLYQVAGDLIQNVPERLNVVDNELNRTFLALSKMGEDFYNARLPLSDRKLVQDAMQYMTMSREALSVVPQQISGVNTFTSLRSQKGLTGETSLPQDDPDAYPSSALPKDPEFMDGVKVIPQPEINSPKTSAEQYDPTDPNAPIHTRPRTMATPGEEYGNPSIDNNPYKQRRHQVLAGYYRPNRSASLDGIISAWQDRGDKVYDDSMPLFFTAQELWPHREYTWTRSNARSGNARLNGKTVWLEGPDKWDLLKADLASQGWDSKEPLHFQIGRRGGAKVAEGNHRLAIARALGLRKIPVFFHFYSSKVVKEPQEETVEVSTPRPIPDVAERVESPEDAKDTQELVDYLMTLFASKTASCPDMVFAFDGEDYTLGGICPDTGDLQYRHDSRGLSQGILPNILPRMDFRSEEDIDGFFGYLDSVFADEDEDDFEGMAERLASQFDVGFVGTRPAKRQRRQRGKDRQKARRWYRKNRQKAKAQARKRYRALRNNPKFKRQRKLRRKFPKRFKRRQAYEAMQHNLAASFYREEFDPSDDISKVREGVGVTYSETPDRPFGDLQRGDTSSDGTAKVIPRNTDVVNNTLDRDKMAGRAVRVDSKLVAALANKVMGPWKFFLDELPLTKPIKHSSRSTLINKSFRFRDVRGMSRGATFSVEIGPLLWGGRKQLFDAAATYDSEGYKVLRIVMNSQLTPAEFKTVGFVTIEKALQDVIRHELAHLMDDDFQKHDYQGPDKGWRAYYNDPAEVVAYTANIAQDMTSWYEREGFWLDEDEVSLQDMVHLALRASKTWAQISPHLNEQNRKKVLSAAYREIADIHTAFADL